MEATNFGVLQLINTTVNNTGGKITASSAGASVQLSGNTVIRAGR